MEDAALGGEPRPSPLDLATAKGQELTNEPILDCSAAPFIDLPLITNVQSRPESRPPEYLAVYDKALAFYDKKHYEEAKDQLLSLLAYGNPSPSLYSYLLRSYRRMVDKQIEDRKFQDAHGTLVQLFDTCESYVTDTDRRKFNRVVDQLRRDSPAVDYRKKELLGVKAKAGCEIDATTPNHPVLVSETKMGKQDRRLNRNRNFTEPTLAGTLFVESLYDRGQSKHTESLLIVMEDNGGHVNKEFTVNHTIYRFKAAEASDRFVAASDDMVLYYYSLENGCLTTCDLRKHFKGTTDKYHTRCVDISPEGQFLLFTNVDQALLLDSDLRQIATWRTPSKEGLQKGTRKDPRYPEYQKVLSILGLSGNPAKEEIRTAFRRKIFECHPDRNPDDPTATETTVKLLDAYQRLTGEDPRQAFVGLKDREYYYKVLDRFRVDVPGGSFVIEARMTMPGEDWIYSTCLGDRAQTVHLGCYSGKVYSIDKNRRVDRVYDCHDCVAAIRQNGRHLYLQTYSTLFIIRDGEYLTHIVTGNDRRLIWADGAFLLVHDGNRNLRLFSAEGTELARIRFPNSILDAYWAHGQLRVNTRGTEYLFSVS
jgi:hypothetical protein